jgi:hypothetical protein
MDFTLRETDRAIKELKFKGVEIWARRDREPLDSEDYFPYKIDRVLMNKS